MLLRWLQFHRSITLSWQVTLIQRFYSKPQMEKLMVALEEKSEDYQRCWVHPPGTMNVCSKSHHIHPEVVEIFQDQQTNEELSSIQLCFTALDHMTTSFVRSTNGTIHWLPVTPTSTSNIWLTGHLMKSSSCCHSGETKAAAARQGCSVFQES